MDRLCIEWDIHIIKTSNAKSTAQRLKFLCEIYSKMNIDTKILMGTAEAVKLSRPTLLQKENKNLIKIWASLPGFSSISGLVMSKNFTLREILTGASVEDITVNSRKLTKKQKESITNINGAKLLAAFPGFSKTSAEMIMFNRDFSFIMDPENMEIMKTVSIGKTKVGVAKMNTIYHYTNLKYQCGS